MKLLNFLLHAEKQLVLQLLVRMLRIGVARQSSDLPAFDVLKVMYYAIYVVTIFSLFQFKRFTLITLRLVVFRNFHFAF